MSDPDKAGRTSGVTADDIGKTANIGELTPGKATRVPGDDKIGEAWIDNGARCDGSYADGCFLTDGQRSRLIIRIMDRMVTAATNYKLALTQLRVDELLKKEGDLPWVISLALDVATGFIMSQVTKALTKIRATGLAKIEAAETDAALHGEASERSKTDKIIAGLSDKRIEKWTKTAFDAAGKKVKGVANKAKGAADASEKTEAIAFIDQLTDACDVGYEKFATNAAATADDAELRLLFEGLDPELHSVGLYKGVLGEKLKRFEASGVTKLGRKVGKDRETGYADVKQDTRVVWVQTDFGTTMLWYQEQDGDYDPAVVEPGDPGSDVLPEPQPGHLKFGTRSPRNDADLIKAVPVEFREAAIARSEQIWGPTPTIPSPQLNYLRQIGSKQTAPSSKTSGSAAPAPAPTPPRFRH